MSDVGQPPPETPVKSWRRMAWETSAALAVICSVVIVLHGSRIDKECGCSRTVGWIVWSGALVVVVGLALWLSRLACGARLLDKPTRRALLAEQFHDVVAASVPWTMAVIGVVLLTVPSQTADMLAGIQGDRWDDVKVPLFPFAIGATAWALSAWFCGRWGTDIDRRNRGGRGSHENWFATWNPRLIALFTGFAIIFIAVKVAGLCSYAALVASMTSAGVFVFAFLRRHLFRRRAGVIQPEVLPSVTRGRWAELLTDIRIAPGGAPALAAGLAVSVTVIVMFGIDPQLATQLESPGTVLLGLGCLTMLATFLSKAGRRLVGVPVLLPSILLTTLLGQLDIGVNHDIRKVPGTNPPPDMAVRSLGEAADSWLLACGEKLLERDDSATVLKVVLVSTAGGASRAALWTLNALAELERKDRQFPRRVFAISAVSGGAVGATIWSALLAHENFDCAKDIPDDDGAERRRKAGNEILSGDFLAPVLAAWISRDVPLGVVPLNVVLRNIGIHADDRAVALEKAWEASWSMKFHDDFLGRNFLGLWNGIFNRPLLLLNGTVEDTGQPIVTAPVAIVDEFGLAYADLPATYDALWTLRPGVRISTAALNSARFPVITSQGDIRISRCPDGRITTATTCGRNENGDIASLPRKISVVDGGYFDNIGAGTTLRAARAIREAFDRSPLAARARLRIMVVGINSDPDRRISPDNWKYLDPEGARKGDYHDEVNQLMRCGGPASTLSIGEKGFANTLDAEIAPVLAIVNTQSGHTVLRLAELNELFCSKNKSPAAPENYVMLSLCPPVDKDHYVVLPLNWVLPPATRRFLSADKAGDYQPATLCENPGEFEFYTAWFKPR